MRGALLQSRFAREEIEALRRQIDRYERQNSPGFAARYREQLEQREREAFREMAAVDDLIASFGEVRGRTILRYYFQLGMSDAQIGEKMSLSDEWVRKRRYAVIRALERAADNANGANRKLRS